MMFLGSFSFDAYQGKQHSTGHFSVLVEASDVDAAVTLFKETIPKLKEDALSDEKVKVYLNDILSIPALTEPAVVTFSSSRSFGSNIGKTLVLGPEAIEEYGDDPDEKLEPFLEWS